MLEIKQTQKREIETLKYKMMQLRNKPYRTLNNVYKDYSDKKIKAYDYCLLQLREISKEEAPQYWGIISHNIMQFTYGIITNKHFYYITKCYGKKVKLEYMK